MPGGTIQQSEVQINITTNGKLDGRSSRCTAVKTALDAGGVPVQVSDNSYPEFIGHQRR
jgi:hypothetical protein